MSTRTTYDSFDLKHFLSILALVAISLVAGIGASTFFNSVMETAELPPAPALEELSAGELADLVLNGDFKVLHSTAVDGQTQLLVDFRDNRLADHPWREVLCQVSQSTAEMGCRAVVAVSDR